jgi:hypothetical protein
MSTKALTLPDELLAEWDAKDLIAELVARGAVVIEIPSNLLPVELQAYRRCQAHKDGECTWALCPQIRDGEPKKSGRHCPL